MRDWKEMLVTFGDVTLQEANALLAAWIASFVSARPISGIVPNFSRVAGSGQHDNTIWVLEFMTYLKPRWHLPVSHRSIFHWLVLGTWSRRDPSVQTTRMLGSRYVVLYQRTTEACELAILFQYELAGMWREKLSACRVREADANECIRMVQRQKDSAI